MRKKYSYLFYSFETDRQDSSPIIDEEFDDATEVAQRENKVIELEEPSKNYKKLTKEN